MSGQALRVHYRQQSEEAAFHRQSARNGKDGAQGNPMNFRRRRGAQVGLGVGETSAKPLAYG